jgi:hypothetical protein
MCYVAVNNDDVKDLGRWKERKKKFFLISFSFLPFPFLNSCFPYITSLMLPVYKNSTTRITEFFNCLHSSGLAGGRSGAPATYSSPRDGYMGCKTNIS